MKHRIVLLFFLFCSSKLFCQHGTLTLSNDFKIAEGQYKHETVTNSVYFNNNFYTVTNSAPSAGKWLFTKLYDVKFSLTVSEFDKDMNKIREVVLENGDKNFGPLIPKLISFHDRLYLTYFKAADKTSFSVYLAALDENNLTLGEPKLICTIKQDNVGLGQIESVINAGLVYFVISPDNARLLAVCKAAPNKVQAVLLDDKLATIKQSLVSVNLQDFEIPSAVLTNDNRACLVLDSKDGTRLLCIGPDGAKTEIRYNAAASFAPYITRARLVRDGKSIIIYSTTIESGGSDSWCTGIMVARLDPATFRLSKPLTYALTPEFIQAISEQGGGTKHKHDYFMSNFTPQLLELDNGDVAIIGSPEMISEKSSTSAPNMNGQTHEIATTTVTVGPVIVLFPDKNGKTYNPVIVPREIILSKSQSSGSGAIRVVASPRQSDVSTGFLATQIGGDIVIIYNDNVKNLSKDAGEKLTVSKSPGDLELAEALVNKDKKLEYRKLISETTKGRATFYLGSSVPSNSSSIVFPIGKEGQGFNALKTYYTNWCFLEIK
ncbi:MAG TPA: hypothetical protein VGQ51_03440 [Puia sp.]|jgi:hypothetical protein|nr:hypothetical protein [Puia sp.]